MTTAHRPTYNPTKGSSSILPNPSLQHSSRDLPANMNIKYRGEGQGTIGEIKQRDFKSELIKREREAKGTAQGQGQGQGHDIESLLYQLNDSEEIQPQLLLDTDNKLNTKDKVIDKEEEEDEVLVFPQDKDVSYSDDDDYDDVNEGIIGKKKRKRQYDSDSIDSEEELMIELEKIKQHQKEEKEKRELELKEKTQYEILKRNPLLNQSNTSNSIDFSNDDYNSNNILSNGDYSLKRKWYEDSVFKNQSKLEQKVQKRFINDTVRSDFHRKFLSKTIQ